MNERRLQPLARISGKASRVHLTVGRGVARVKWKPREGGGTGAGESKGGSARVTLLQMFLT